MKIKSLLLGMTCVAAFAACSNEDVVENNAPVNNKLEGDAYVAVNIALAGDKTRAAAGDEVDGSAAENGISDVAFLFYNEDQLLQTVRKSDLAGINDDGNSDVTKAVIVLKNPGVVPTSVVAILNPSVDAFPTTLSALKAKADYSMTSTADNTFVMSNSTFKKENGTVQMETVITPANVATTPDAAKLAPVTVYVERALAKVTADCSKVKVELPETSIDGESSNLSVDILGWNLSGTNKTSYVLKHIKADWAGAWWIGTNRTFWAEDTNYEAATTDQDALNFFAFPVDKPAQAYCLENTFDSYATNYLAATHLVVSAEIKVDGTAQSLYEYLGQKYTETGVKNLMSKNSTVSKYYVLTSGEAPEKVYESFKPGFIDLDVLSTKTSYMVTPQLTSDAKNMTFYTLSPDGETATPVVTSEVEAAVKALGDVAKYKDGKCYYYVAIDHIGEGGLGEKGIVRNHVYNLSINSIKGFGTPVPDPSKIIIPEKPSKSDYYVAAKVEVLKWKVISQGVDFE